VPSEVEKSLSAARRRDLDEGEYNRGTGPSSRPSSNTQQNRSNSTKTLVAGER